MEGVAKRLEASEFYHAQRPRLPVDRSRVTSAVEVRIGGLGRVRVRGGVGEVCVVRLVCLVLVKR